MEPTIYINYNKYFSLISHMLWEDSICDKIQLIFLIFLSWKFVFLQPYVGWIKMKT